MQVRINDSEVRLLSRFGIDRRKRRPVTGDFQNIIRDFVKLFGALTAFPFIAFDNDATRRHPLRVSPSDCRE